MFALIVAIPLGILQVVRRNTPVDYALTGCVVRRLRHAGVSPRRAADPLVRHRPGMVRVRGAAGRSVWGILADPRALVLPVITLAVMTIAGFSRYMRSSMMETLTEDYIRTARAKGASPRRVIYQPRAAERPDPDHHAARPDAAGDRRRCDHHRDRLQLSRMGLLTTNAATQNDVPLLHRHDVRRSDRDRARQPDRRRALRRRRPEGAVCIA